MEQQHKQTVMRTDKHPIHWTLRGWERMVNSRTKSVLAPINKYST